jgi:hypothetical protein
MLPNIDTEESPMASKESGKANQRRHTMYHASFRNEGLNRQYSLSSYNIGNSGTYANLWLAVRIASRRCCMRWEKNSGRKSTINLTPKSKKTIA